ncbi:ATP-binding protein [Nocardia sp. CDC160]|uniref:ATP-binding protein n=1 Tax=Nocardia sp. CDC160 TaxID=3112166 RepID=UPI002DB82834|nr:ATP-binding protein [Nocardia sp. CDC160]MEC3920029.1 ATP-binding protein [Nocardia sp. CDC160]
MFSLGPRSVRLRTQILLLQIAVVGLTLGLAFGVFAYVSGERLSNEYGQRALAIARTVASDPQVRAEVARYADSPVQTGPALRQELAAGNLEGIAESARLRTDALFVVITDDAGIRLAHPDRSRLGEKVSTDPSRALAGSEVVIQEHGTLGESVRAKVPVLRPDSVSAPAPAAQNAPGAAPAPETGSPGTGTVPAPGAGAESSTAAAPAGQPRERVVGEVSVGISTAAVRDQLLRDLRRAGLLIGGALLAGIAGSVLLARRWHGLTLGLEPSDLADLVREQDAVLHGIGEGVVAVDSSWRITVVNDEARRLLGIDPAPGSEVDAIGLTPRVLQAFRDADGEPVQAAVGERIVVVTARTVTRDSRALGAVLSVRDRTDVESLTRQLDAVSTMSTVLRAQRHEFANRLHLLSGLLHTDRPDEATRYLDDLLGTGPLGATLPGLDAIRDPYLQAFLAAKAAHARERGVQLRLGPNTWVDANLSAPVDVTTVLGNLIDNAIDAAAADGASEPVVEVELVRDGETLHIAVADSGAGVAAELMDSLFAEGVSTKAGGGPGGRGLGLALSRQVARARGGDVRLADPGGDARRDAGPDETPLAGAEFIARMPGVLSEEEAAWAAEN